MSDTEWKKVSTNALAWDPEKDKEIVGVLTDLRENVGKFKSTLCTLELAGGEERAVWCNKLLADKMKKVPLGSEVKITFIGKKEAKTGTGEYKDYDVSSRPAPMKEVEAAEEAKF